MECIFIFQDDGTQYIPQIIEGCHHKAMCLNCRGQTKMAILKRVTKIKVVFSEIRDEFSSIFTTLIPVPLHIFHASFSFWHHLPRFYKTFLAFIISFFLLGSSLLFSWYILFFCFHSGYAANFLQAFSLCRSDHNAIFFVCYLIFYPISHNKHNQPNMKT